MFDADEKYDTTSSGAHGMEYQLKIFMLFAERGLFKNYHYKLANEMKKAGKFDDIVFLFEHEGKKFGSFLQCKHAENAGSKNITAKILITDLKNGDFSLPNYFLSYLDIKIISKIYNLKNLLYAAILDLNLVISMMNLSSMRIYLISCLIISLLKRYTN